MGFANGVPSFYKEFERWSYSYLHGERLQRYIRVMAVKLLRLASCLLEQVRMLRVSELAIDNGLIRGTVNERSKLRGDRKVQGIAVDLRAGTEVGKQRVRRGG